jgi:hypothetical protein
MTKGVVLAVALATSACISPQEWDTIEGQQEAMEIVWREVYKRTDSFPKVQWIRDDQLDCKPKWHTGPENIGFFYSFDATKPPLCLAGLNHYDRLVIAKPSIFNFSDTTLPHEAAHHLLVRDRKDPDREHSGPYFVSGGLSYQATAELAKRGL